MIRDDYNAAVARLKKSAMDEGSKLISAAFKPLFDMAPNLEKIQWTQYTPYFNDGDICEFGVNEPGFVLNHENKKYYDCEISRMYDADYAEKHSWAKENNERLTALGGNDFFAKYKEIWNAIPREFLEHAFGDHKLVTVTRENIEVREYRHD